MDFFGGMKSALGVPSRTQTVDTTATPMPSNEGGYGNGGYGGGNDGFAMLGANQFPTYFGGLTQTGFNPGSVQLLDSEAQGALVAQCEQIEALTKEQKDKVYPALEGVITADTALHARHMQTATKVIKAIGQQQSAAGEVHIAAINAGMMLTGTKQKIKRAQRFASGHTGAFLRGAAG